MIITKVLSEPLMLHQALKELVLKRCQSQVVQLLQQKMQLQMQKIQLL